MITSGQALRDYARLGAAVMLLALVTAVPAAATSQPLLGIAAKSGQFQPYSPNTSTVTYDQTAVPPGARVFTLNLRNLNRTVVVLGVHGLAPSREYGAHVHTKTCGANPADAGPHYQNVPDPQQPSTNPAYANNRNEIWLDFTVDAQGNGLAIASVDWQFPDAQRARSVVIHEHHTHTDGTAGARLACMTTSF
jgi:Cu-Zn family superoxide dismutase